MAFQVSPGVQVNEIDATNVVPAVSTSIGGFAGSFNWGPVSQVVTVGSENELAETFGKPDNNTAKYFLVAASFLKYGNALKVVRVASGHDNATADGSGQLIKNNDDYVNNYADGSLSKGNWVAKYPGDLGNSLKVSMVTEGITSFSGWTYAANFDAAPGTSQYAIDQGKTTAKDEVHVAVVDEDGAISGTPGTVLETFAFVSQGSDAKNSDGTTNFYKDVINSTSEYIWWADHDTSLTDAGETIASNTTFTVNTAAIEHSLSGGSDDNAPTVGEIQTGYDLLEDADTVDVNLLFATPDANGAEAIAEDLISIVNLRKDCMAFISPPIEDTVGSSTPAADVKAFADGLTSTSYASCDSTAVYVYDKYNDVYRWIGAAGHHAGLCANTDSVADAWFSPAGVNRGQLLGVTKLAFNPKKADRDSLYKARVNPIVSLPGQGTLLFGDKTLLSRPSAFDRINVRRLFIALEKAVSTAAKAQLFEFNDEFTRAQFRNLVEPFLRDVKGRRGLTDFSVICDNTNNTSAVIDGNKFVADIYIKPSRSINFISLNFVATRSGVEFSEISGS
jgi:phage tail sheath protein FI|tara:strand:+ start:6135 stop:7820 length:1686 start_codon:yes stop_codon:yes gene_type:complete